MRHYKLVDRKAVPCGTDDWALAFEKNDRIVKQETIGGFFISTVFLGLDHSFRENGPPLIFETMVFDQREDGGNASEDYCERCSTWAEAKAQHEAAVKIYRRLAEGSEVTV